MGTYTINRNDLIFDLIAAFNDAKKHKSSKSYVIEFEKNLGRNINLLADELLNRNYKPQPYNCFIVNSYTKREVFAAQFRDRVVHHLYFNYTHKLFERTFIQDTYSCIKHRGTHYGVNRLRKKILTESENYKLSCYVLKLDIKGYFMHINRNHLVDIAFDTINKMANHKINKQSGETWKEIIDIDFILWLTKEIILIDPKVGCCFRGKRSDWKGLDKNKSLFNTDPGLGLPIGNLTSQLFSNVYLNVFDQFMKRILKCRHYGRYVDDAYVVSANKEWLLSLVPEIREFLKLELGLDLHMGKLKIQKAKYGVEFLGAFIKPFRTYICNHSLKRMVININFNNPDREKVWNSINSYLGILSHYSSFRIRFKLFFIRSLATEFIFDEHLLKMGKPPS